MEKIRLIKSTFLDEKKTKKKLCRFIKKSKFLSMNFQCALFEKNFAKKQGRKYAVFVSSGSAANLGLIQTLLNTNKLKKGDKVLVSALTWSTNVMPLLQLGLNPIPVDCNINTLNIDLEKIKEMVKKEGEIKGLFITNALGLCSDLDKIANFCDEKDILFIEDNCEGLGSVYKNRRLGNFGIASTFSFFVGHHISTIEGGMIVTDDPELYESIKITRAHGWTRNNSEEFSKKLSKKYSIEDFYVKYSFYDLAYNLRPTEINGFLGNSQLRFWDFIVSRRERIFRVLSTAATKNKEIIPLETKGMNKISNFGYPLLFKNKEACRRYMKRFTQSKVEIRPIISGSITNQPFFRKYSKKFHCPNAEKINNFGFYIPNNPELTDSEIRRMEGIIRD